MRGKVEDIGRYEMGVAFPILLSVAGAVYLAFADQPEPVEISNATELQEMRNDLDGNYVLVDDIDLSRERA